jgi:hypothetical protein
VQEKAGNTLDLIGIGNDFLNRTQMAQQLRERIDKWDYMKLRNFCTTKEMATRLKRLPTELEKIFASYKSVKRLITRIYRELKKLNSQKINDPMKKSARELNSAFSKVQMAKQHMKKSSPSLAIKEMQIKTMLRFYLTPVRTAATIKDINKCHQGCGEKGTLIDCWWECKLVQPLWKIVEILLKKLKIELPCDMAIPFLEIYAKECESGY